MSLLPRRVDPADTRAVAAIRKLLAEAEQADGGSPISDQALIAALSGDRALFAFDAAPRQDSGAPHPVAVGILGDGELDLVVRPAARGAGAGRSALGLLLAEADRTAPGALRAWAHGENPAATALLAGAGFAPTRTLYRLALDPERLAAAIAGARPLPAGYRTEAFDAANPAHIDAWVRVNAAAFADHPEQGSLTAAGFAALREQEWFDPQDLILAVNTASNDIVGFTWVKTLRTEDATETELYVLGVDPAYAGRGLGAALLGTTLARMRVHRPDRITLYVDGENTQARSLYARAGFEVDAVSTQWSRNGG